MNKRIFVAGLPFSTTSEELKNLFAEVGIVVSAAIITDRMTGQSKGFGFVEMDKEGEVKEAISKFNDFEFGGRKLIVAKANPVEQKTKPSFKGTRGGFSRQKKSFGERREGGRGSFGRGGGRSLSGHSFGGGRH